MYYGRLMATAAVAGLLAWSATGPAAAQVVPPTPDEVALPGGTLPGDPELTLVQVADGFLDPVGVANAADGSNRVFVVERAGRVKVVNADGSVQEEPFIDLTQLNPLGTIVQTQFVEQGLFAIAFHPDFSENGHFYLHYSSLPFNGDGMIVRYTVDPDSPDVVSTERANETAKVIMRIEQPWYNHNGGRITFGPDGYLYIASGDGGWEGDPYGAGQDLSTWLGKILRIDVDVPEDAHEHYRIPPDNPFADAAKERPMVLFGISEETFAEIKVRSKPEIWAYGVRNPYQMHFDDMSGDLFIADVGQNHWEMIFWQPADSAGGENYGWNFKNGTKCFPLLGPDQECDLVGLMPAAEYPHRIPYPDAEPIEEGYGCSVQGLGVANYAGLSKTYLVGDWCSGRVWGLGWDDEGERWQFQEFMETDLQFTAGDVDEEGHVYAVTANNFYLADEGPDANPPGALWRFYAPDDVPEDADVARTRN